MIKRTLCVMFAVLLLTTLSGALPARALDDATYNLASVQTDKRLKLLPGGETRAALYFYNVDGNRTTHLSLRVSQVPAGWVVRVEPPEQQVLVDAGGRMVEVKQNLHVEPSPLLAEPARDVPDGGVSLEVGTRGYTIAKVAHVVVQAPESAKPGDTGEIRVSADASWTGQSGAATIRQGRDFDFVAEVMPGLGTISHAVPGAGEATGKTGEGEATDGAAGREPDLAAFLDRWTPTILALVIVVIGSIVIPTLTARKVRESGRAGRPNEQEE
jgi:hypothetical protein